MVSVKRILADLSVFRRQYLRNRTGFFFALVFPVILIGIFGAIFSGGSSGPITVYAQNQDSSGTIGTELSASDELYQCRASDTDSIEPKPAGLFAITFRRDRPLNTPEFFD